MLTEQKEQVLSLIEEYKVSLGSYAKVANRCQVSEATISQIRAHNWENIADSMWTKIASALGYVPQGWQVADTRTKMSVWAILRDAKINSLFMAISHRAGSGKTAALKTYRDSYGKQAVYYISCREWAKREFLANLAKSLGIEAYGKALSVDNLLMEVVSFFNRRRADRPLLVFDEVDKLKGAAMRSIITLYNECEDGLGVVIAGTDHLQKQMESDARYNRKGAEELLSRFGRRFIHLPGSNANDVAEICRANGISDSKIIKEVFSRCEPVQRIIGNRSEMVIEDLRRVKREVQRTLMLNNSGDQMTDDTEAAG